MIVTSTELKTHFGRYLNVLGDEDIYVTKNGKTVARLTSENISHVNQIRGILQGEPVDKKDIRGERLKRHENNV